MHICTFLYVLIFLLASSQQKCLTCCNQRDLRFGHRKIELVLIDAHFDSPPLDTRRKTIVNTESRSKNFLPRWSANIKSHCAFEFPLWPSAYLCDLCV